jgi:probable F420-dependent oxidoreductase
MSERRDALRARLGRVGVWSFGLQANTAEAAQAAVRAYEDLGYPATWFPESTGSKEAFAQAGLLLAGSPRMVVATGIASIYARDPAAMMGGARTLSEAYPGRFVLGLGVSHAPAVQARGGTYGRPVETMAAYLDAMAASPWAGPALSDPPAILLAALGPRMLDLAAERTDGAHPYFVPVEHTRLARERLGADPVLAVEIAGVVDGDPARARETARGFAARYLQLDNYANNLRRLGWAEDDLAGGGSDRLIDAVVVQGDVRAVAGRVREHLDAGADHVCVQLRSPVASDLCVGAYAELRAALEDVAPGGAGG